VAFHFHRRDFDALSRQIFYYMRGHVAALMIQYEKSRHVSNLKRAFVWLPRWYGGRLIARILRGPTERDRFLFQEITGHLSGLLFYVLPWRRCGSRVQRRARLR
jgi:hypothetical protein